MASGGSYNAPSAEDTRAGFGNDTQMDSMVGGGSNGGHGGPAGVTNTPLFGDYKKYVSLLLFNIYLMHVILLELLHPRHSHTHTHTHN